MLEIFEINTKNNFFALLHENLSNLYETQILFVYMSMILIKR